MKIGSETKRMDPECLAEGKHIRSSTERKADYWRYVHGSIYAAENASPHVGSTFMSPLRQQQISSTQAAKAARRREPDEADFRTVAALSCMLHAPRVSGNKAM